MSFARNQTTANSHLLNPAESGTPRPLGDRSIIGIPAEDDEFTRGLTFFIDPSTGQPSVHSTSEDSDDPGVPPYEASPPSNNTSSCRVLTPMSVSDASGGLHPRLVSSGSVVSSEGGSSDSGGDRTHPPEVSASTGSSQAASSPTSIQTPSHLPKAMDHMATTMSPAVDPPTPEPSGPFGEMGDPRAIISVGPNDVRFLENIMDPSRSENLAQGLNPIDLVDNQVGRSIAPPFPDTAQGSRTECGKGNPRNRSSMRAVAIRANRVSQPGSNPRRRRPSAKDAMERAKEADRKKLMRLFGVCLPCLVNHEQCDLETICFKCFNSKIQKTPCIRPHLSQAILFRKGALSFPEGPPEIRNWVSERNVTLLLYNVGPADPSVLPESRPWLRVRCREFPVTPGIRSSKSWTKGTYKIDIHFPNFAMTKWQYSQAGKSLDALVNAAYDKLVRELAVGQEDIISWTLKEAVRQAETCGPIKGALQLSILSRLASKSFNLFGQETLGIQQEQDPDCPYYQRIPIPPLLDAQLDSILMERMKSLRKTVLSRLRRMIAGQGRKHWFKIYLTIFVLLFNLESVYQNQCRQIKRYEEPTQQQQALLHSWENSAQNLIEHFRAVCRGHIPLNMEWSKTDEDAAEVDGQSLEFISRVKRAAESRAEDLRQKSKASCDTPLVWISALFAP